MPDAALVPLAVARPTEWWSLGLVAAAGSSVGGLVSYTVGRAAPVRPLLARLPLVRPPMVVAADAWLANEDAAGLRHQPLSGLPSKVFAVLAGDRRIALGPFLFWAVVARGGRFMTACGLAGLLGRRFTQLLDRYPRPLLALWTGIFLLGLRRAVLMWERRDAERS
jgi:membrane protein YqaA with SNARE-associated domain